METKEFIQNKSMSFNWQITFKVVIIGVIAIALLIPKFMIIELIGERERTADISKNEVMQKWSLAQTVRGPVLSIPYIERNFDTKEGQEIELIKTLYVLPKSLKVKGEIIPQKLYRSIYETVVYESGLNFSGSFEKVDFDALKIPGKDVLWEKAKIEVAISDLRGIQEIGAFSWNAQSDTFLPGMENALIGATGISLLLPQITTSDFPANFGFTLQLKGSESLQFAPIGEITEVELHSNWNDPGFEGSFLPTERNVDNEGFTARWKVLNFNRNFPQQWKNEEYKVTNADFGVKLVTVADHYQKNSRSAKYGILVILFTFLAFFLNEIIAKVRVHPFQYILVGFAVLVFYLLLLSISEQLGFNLAYFISALAVITMVFAYSRTFLKSWTNSIVQTLILTFSFGFIFVLMQLESYALLVGSIGLFFILGLTMFFTRKINWYGE
ncbi:MAG TPA: cell envelope integrity protein CreD [Prolixibacteraceae bacterium]|nr:cell envelope integrity protein CreD [Prolixibacteraceae bacterium]